jgi:lysozyme family protein
MNQTEKNNMENIETNKAIDMEFEQAYNKLKEREGGYTDGKKQIKDEPTNMGIKQSTLDRYSAKHPEKNFPSDVKHLTATQAKEIYKYEYWNNTKIPEIKNDRIRDAVFDMNVMGGAGKTVQRTLNSFLDANLVVDGDIGNETIKSINAIVDSKVDEFIIALKTKRIDYLKGTKNWVTAKNGWTIRTNKY